MNEQGTNYFESMDAIKPFPIEKRPLKLTFQPTLRLVENIKKKPPYTLSADEKRNTLQLINWIIENTTDTRVKFTCIKFLKDESTNLAKRYANIANYYSNLEYKETMKELDAYKLEYKRKIIVRHIADLRKGVRTKAYMEDLQKLERMDKNACFVISGTEIYHRECSMCLRKCHLNDKGR